MKTIENTVQDQVIENEKTFVTTVELAEEGVTFDGGFCGGDITPPISGFAAHASRGDHTLPTPNQAGASFGVLHPLRIKHYETISYGCLREWARSF